VCAAAVALATLGALASAPRDARAQTGPEAWRPAPVDSAKLWVQAANQVFAEATTDTITPRDFEAFLLLERVAQRYFTALGPRGMRGAKGVLTVLDSLGAQAEFAQDEQLPQFCALTFFNSKFMGYGAMTFVYWWRGSDLMRQGLRLTGGKNVQLDVWWTGIEVAPYEMALLDQRRTGDVRESFFTMLRLSKQADYWGVVQSGRKDVDLGGPGASRLMDLNGDGVPEIVNYTETAPDPRFVVNHELPPLFSERVWERRDEGFRQLDRRTLAGPFATFVLFLRALEHADLPVARELAASRAVVTQAQTLKLGSYSAAKTWTALDMPAGGPWNHVMRFAYGKPGALTHGLEVTMKYAEGHWIVERLESATAKSDSASAKTAPKTAPKPAPAPPPAPGVGVRR
jgi:hypothetical protein